MPNSYGALASLSVDGRTYQYYRLGALADRGLDVSRLPYSLKVLLENLLRHEDDKTVKADDVRAMAEWDPKVRPDREIAFQPSRVLLQDFTGVPAIVDLAAMRDAMIALGGDPKRINPLQPVELVIDHSVQVDEFGTSRAFLVNAEKEFERNRERYAFLRWGQGAFDNFKVVPPDAGICHQVNLEYLSRVAFVDEKAAGGPLVYPDTLVGTDSHTPMVNGLGVLGWGVGGIEAEAAMLGQPISMLIPQAVGVKLTGKLPEGSTATDLVLTVAQLLRKKGVVGKFVEFYGPGLANLPTADRATIGNMSPEYGATCAIFPPDAETLNYLRLTNRPPERIRLVEEYYKAQGMFHDANSPEPVFSDTLELDLATVEPSIAGPRRPQDRVPLKSSKSAFAGALREIQGARPSKARADAAPATGAAAELKDGSVVIAAITSCTNTSNPAVMIGAGLLARKAAERGLKPRPWVKTSLAPGSKVVTEYLRVAGLDKYLDQLGFNLVGYGCTTCIGNSGPLASEISEAIQNKDLVAVSVLSGNRNFEGRIHGEVRANYLASPLLVVAYALAGRMDFDMTSEPLGHDEEGKPVFLKDVWPSMAEIQQVVASSLSTEQFREEYGAIYDGDDRWRELDTPEGDAYAWQDDSTYVKNPPYFEGMTREPAPPRPIQGARVLALLGDSVTTDHISPAGAIRADSPAGRYLIENGVQRADFNSYGSRRGNHEVMVRGTFANVRLRNKLAPGTEGGWTRFLPGDEVMSIFDASEKYQAAGVPLIILAGKEYGSGSSRDWAAKGPKLLGVDAVIAESYERIHRSNLVGMGIVPLQFEHGSTAESLGLDGEEVYRIEDRSGGLCEAIAHAKAVKVVAEKADGTVVRFPVHVRIDTPQEAHYYENGGILQYVLRQLLTGEHS